MAHGDSNKMTRAQCASPNARDDTSLNYELNALLVICTRRSRKVDKRMSWRTRSFAPRANHKSRAGADLLAADDQPARPDARRERLHVVAQLVFSPQHFLARRDAAVAVLDQLFAHRSGERGSVAEAEFDQRVDQRGRGLVALAPRAGGQDAAGPETVLDAYVVLVGGLQVFDRAVQVGPGAGAIVGIQAYGRELPALDLEEDVLVAEDRAARKLLRGVHFAKAVSVADEKVDRQYLAEAEGHVGIAPHKRLAEQLLLLHVLADAVQVGQFLDEADLDGGLGLALGGIEQIVELLQPLRLRKRRDGFDLRRVAALELVDFLQ